MLVVDDNAAAREILQEPLSAVASRVDVVASGKEAIAAIQQHDAADAVRHRLHGLAHAGHGRAAGQPPHQERRDVEPSAGHRARHGVRTRRSPRGSRAAAARRLSRQAGHQVHDRRHAGERLRPQRGRDAARPRQDEQATRLRGARILLTEDNEINQQIAVELLEGAGATVTVANNGREAVEILSSDPQPPPFDVVLMDLQMPEMDGYQATAKLRSDPRFATLPIIAMTAHATIEERQRCLAAGMNDHIAKPIDPGNLFETVARFYTAGGSRARPIWTRASARLQRPPEDGSHDLPSIAGLDTKDGLSRVGGNRKLYLKLLRQFVEQQGPAVEQITDALARRRHRPRRTARAHAQRCGGQHRRHAGSIRCRRVGEVDSRPRRREGRGCRQTTGRRSLEPARHGIASRARANRLRRSTSHPRRRHRRTLHSLARRRRDLTALLSELDPGAADFRRDESRSAASAVRRRSVARVRSSSSRATPLPTRRRSWSRPSRVFGQVERHFRMTLATRNTAPGCARKEPLT